MAAVERRTASEEASQGRRRHHFKVDGEGQSVENASLSAEVAEPRHGRGKRPGRVIVRVMALAGLAIDGTPLPTPPGSIGQAP